MAGISVSLIRSIPAIAHNVFSQIEGTVKHAAWLRQNGEGDQIFGTRRDGVDIYNHDPLKPGVAVERTCIIEYETKPRDVNGRQVISYAHLIFLVPFEAAPWVSDRRDPIDPRDVIILPDGKSGPIIDSDKGLIDAETKKPYFVEVWLGALSERGAL